MKTKFHERSLVLLKPDTVQRGLVGEVMSRFERKGLKIVAMKMVWASKEEANRHYDMREEDKILLGERTIAAYKERGEELNETPIERAEKIQKRLATYLTAGPIIAMIIEGAHAIQHIRKIRGATNPLSADIGSIVGDYSIDSYFLSDPDERVTRTMVHASGSVEEANREIPIWFKESEIFDYELAIEQILYSKKWEEEKSEITKAHH